MEADSLLSEPPGKLSPCGEPLPTHTSTEDPPTPADSLGSVFCGVTAPFLWDLVCTRFVCALHDWSLCLPKSCGSPVIKSWWPSRSDFLGIPSPFVGSSVREAWCGVQNLHNSGRTSLALFFSSLWVIQAESMGFDFIMTAPLLPSCCNFFLVFGCWKSFFGG